MKTIILTLGMLVDTSDKRLQDAMQAVANDAKLGIPDVAVLLPKILQFAQKFNLGALTEEEFITQFLAILPIPREKFKDAWNEMSKFGLPEKAKGPVKDIKAESEAERVMQQKIDLVEGLVKFQIEMWEKIAKDAGANIDAKALLPKLMLLQEKFNQGGCNNEEFIKALAELFAVPPEKLQANLWQNFTNIVVYSDTNPIHYEHLRLKLAERGLFVGKAFTTFDSKMPKDKLLGMILDNARKQHPAQHCDVIFGNPKLVHNATLGKLEGDKHNALSRLAKAFETDSFKVDNIECAAVLSRQQFEALCQPGRVVVLPIADKGPGDPLLYMKTGQDSKAHDVAGQAPAPKPEAQAPVQAAAAAAPAKKP